MSTHPSDSCFFKSTGFGLDTGVLGEGTWEGDREFALTSSL